MLTEPPPVCLRIVFNSTLTAFTDDPIVAWRLLVYDYACALYSTRCASMDRSLFAFVLCFLRY